MFEPRLSDNGERLNLTTEMKHGGWQHVSSHPTGDKDGTILSFSSGDLSVTVVLNARDARSLGAHLLHLADVTEAVRA